MLPLLVVLLGIVSAILIVVGLVRRRWVVAIVGFVLLALTGLLLYIGVLLMATGR